VTYIAIDRESPGQHECRVALSGCFKGQHKAEILSWLPEDRLGSSVSTSSNATQLEWVNWSDFFFLIVANDVEQQLQTYYDAILHTAFKMFST